jgi:FKBP-type peptidyl-prolyl cis-trans isomerase FkpA
MPKKKIKKMHRYFILSIFSSLILLQSCGDGYKKTASGLKYQFIVDSAGPTAQEGEALLMDILIKTEGDSVLEESFGTSGLVREPAFKGGLEEGFKMLSVGDSASFIISADSFFKFNINQPLPDFLEKGSSLVFNIKVRQIYSKEEIARESAKYQKMAEVEKNRLINEVKAVMDSVLSLPHVKKQMQLEEKQIVDFMKANKLLMAKTSRGVYYSIDVQGKGNTASLGDTIAVNYTGMLLNGKIFDTSAEREPFSFVLGAGQAIWGWEDVMTNFREGDRVKFIVPSSLAYMEYGIPNRENPEEFLIPKNAPLYFEAEIVELRK